MENKRIKLSSDFVWETNAFFNKLNNMHLLEFIFSLCTLKEILLFRLVCKLFNQVFKEKWCKNHFISFKKKIRNKDLKNFNYLKKINLRGCQNIRARGLSYCKEATHINLSECSKITDKELFCLKNATHINLSGCYGITDKGLQYLRGVKSICIDCCIQITNEGLFCLSEVSNISLDWCNEITDLGIFYLQNVHSICFNHNFKIAVFIMRFETMWQFKITFTERRMF